MRAWVQWGLVLGMVSGAPVQADSFTSSASSAGSSASNVSGSVSDSVGMSSDSAKGKKQVVAGRYQVQALEPWTDGRVLVRLQAQDEDRMLTLRLPPQAVQAGQLRAGAVLDIEARSYGWALARSVGEAFFLLLNDARELETKAL
ncbi:hypothetical protein [Inhella gelatinilytica]|uniref:DUF5666 domain-containing protein n=1 Tax=Inhella gelatinilytica TaxID=2795030 RepID=A0A931NAV2_9BURK|nr:hypothetical protein [Inhella gelatinilytica]MBH9552888.1 hypothetical protein [Inhella gelatinilytica]